jgi:cysteine desulfurase/selenocysteine lyase
LALLACQKLKEAFGEKVKIIGIDTPELRSGIVSFLLSDVHPHDTAYLLGERNICIRAGLQCAAPLHETLDLSATTRLSFSIYNTEEDIEKLIAGLQAVREKIL